MPDFAAQIIKRTDSGAIPNESRIDPGAAEIVMEPGGAGGLSCR